MVIKRSGSFARIEIRWQAAGLPLTPIDPADEFVIRDGLNLRRRGSELAFAVFLE